MSWVAGRTFSLETVWLPVAWLEFPKPSSKHPSSFTPKTCRDSVTTMLIRKYTATQLMSQQHLASFVTTGAEAGLRGGPTSEAEAPIL